MKSMIALALAVGVPAGFLESNLPASAYTEKTFYTFCSIHRCKDGSVPFGVVVDQTGNLFGVTAGGGKSAQGTVFEFMPGTGQYSALYSFCKKALCSDGAQPVRVNLVIDTQGNLYGTTGKGGGALYGVVFELFPKDGKWREKVLYSFCSRRDCADGAQPYEGLTYAGAASGAYDGVSPLYGTTYSGGGGTHEGTVFSLTPKAGAKTWNEHVLYAFYSQTKCKDGANPDAPLYIDGRGNIFGTAAGGLTSYDGVVFELSPSGSGYAETLPYAFCQQAKCADGAAPLGGVVMDTSGNLYGTTSAGSSGGGVLFKLSPNGSQWQYSNLADFDGSDGNISVAPLIIDADGDLFGTTLAGGTRQHGNVFEFNGSIQSLYSFCPERKCGDGDAPESGVVEDSAGNLYGVASERGHHNNGTLFEVSP